MGGDQPCGWKGNRTSGVTLHCHASQALVVLHLQPLLLFSEFGAVYKYPDLLTYLLTYLQAQGLGEGDEHPLMLFWSIGDFTFTFTY